MSSQTPQIDLGHVAPLDEPIPYWSEAEMALYELERLERHCKQHLAELADQQ